MCFVKSSCECCVCVLDDPWANFASEPQQCSLFTTTGGSYSNWRFSLRYFLPRWLSEARDPNANPQNYTPSARSGQECFRIYIYIYRIQCYSSLARRWWLCLLKHLILRAFLVPWSTCSKWAGCLCVCVYVESCFARINPVGASIESAGECESRAVTRSFHGPHCAHCTQYTNLRKQLAKRNVQNREKHIIIEKVSTLKWAIL